MKTNENKTVKRWIWTISGFAVFVLLVWKLERLTTLALVSFMVAYVLDPLVTRMSKLKFIGRISATAITMFGLVVGFLGVLVFIIPEVVEEFRAFSNRLPQLIGRAQEYTIPWIENGFGVSIPTSWHAAFEQLYQKFEGNESNIVAPAAKIAGQLFGKTFSAVFSAIGTLMFPLFLFFLLKDFPLIIKTVDDLIPNSTKNTVHMLVKDIDDSLSAFLHGQFTVMIVLGTLYSIGYSIVGIHVAIGVGFLTGILCFIPYVGAAVGFLIALLLSALEMSGWGSILGVAIVFAVVQGLDAIVITPKILGGKLGLQPLWIIAALMAGGELFGFLGILLAVPTIAILKILVKHSINKYKNSSFYNGDGADNLPIADNKAIATQSSSK